MPPKLTITLSDRDLRHFRRELDRARASVQIADDEEIVAAARDLLGSMRHSKLPDFVTERLDRLETVMAMLGDRDWTLTARERGLLLGSLAYLCDPEDIIPDDIPGIGLLDDAVMIALAFRDLRHQIEAYEDFVAFRAALAQRPARLRREEAGTAAKLARRRAQLIARMRRRQAAERRRK
ncbi:MAG TPA: YkvA family protein [Steroidobacteraceae bacterium]|nr:YkvA family protein [Steroidobacteraceae bacterium]